MKTKLFPILHTPNMHHQGQLFEIDIKDLDKTWFASDHHFFHKNVIEYCDRPFKDLEEMHEALIAYNNDLVAPDDTLFLLGDICFGGKEKWADIMMKMNGKKTLIRGNHDGVNRNALVNMGIEVALFGQIQIMDGETVLDCLNLSHYPYATKGDGHAAGERYTEKRILDNDNVLLHGHVHQGWKTRANMINVGVDVWGMRPVNLKDLWEIAKDVG